MIAGFGEVAAALIGAVVGAVLATALGHWSRVRGEKQARKLHILAVLMGGRGRIFSQDVSDAVNLIPVVFADNQDVRRAYQHFCAVSPKDWDLFFGRYVDLVVEVSNSLGYRRGIITAADVSLGFYPNLPPPPTPPVQAPETAQPRKPWWKR